MKRKLFHKSLGGFDVIVTTYVGIPTMQSRKRVDTAYRVMVQVDAAALVRLLGERAVKSKGGKVRLAGGAVEIINLGGVVI